MKGKHCGLMRREPDGRWYYGESLVGIDNEPIPGALEDAMRQAAEAPAPDLPDSRAPARQLTFSWPVEAPVVAIDENESLAHAHAQVWGELDRGTFCPCCQRNARRYPRPLHAEMAAFLVRLVRVAETSKKWLHLRELLPGTEDTPKASTDGSYLVLWGLVKRHPERNGLYRPTPAGIAFVRGRTTVPKVAWVYDGRASHFSKEVVGIRQALEDKLDVLAMLGDRAGPGGDR
jgi:hypothetical protein